MRGDGFFHPHGCKTIPTHPHASPLVNGDGNRLSIVTYQNFDILTAGNGLDWPNWLKMGLNGLNPYLENHWSYELDLALILTAISDLA